MGALLIYYSIITELLPNYYRLFTGANSALSGCPNPVLILAESCPIPVLILSEYVFEKVQLPCPIPVLILAETCPNPVRAKTQKTDYPLPGGMALLFYPSKVIKSEIVASKSICSILQYKTRRRRVSSVLSVSFFSVISMFFCVDRARG